MSFLPRMKPTGNESDLPTSFCDRLRGAVWNVTHREIWGLDSEEMKLIAPL